MPSRIPWVWGGLAPAGNEARLLAQLNERMTDLESYLQTVHRELEFGPVRGAALSIQLGKSTDTGTSLPTGVVDQYVFAFESRPVQISLVCYDGNVTVDVTSQGSSLLSAGAVSLVAATPQSFADSPDFALATVTSDLTLDIQSIDAGTPTHVRVTILALDVTQIEPL